jgi:hypothetical protein
MMIAMNGENGKKEFTLRDIMCKFPSPILEGDVLYANSAGTLKCMSWPEGKLKWAAGKDVKLGDGGSIVRCGDKIIAMSERGQLFLIYATPEGYKVLSQKPLFDYSMVWSTPMIYRGKLYAKGENELVCLDISDQKQ